ncbi:hypothetical protein [uncultured Phocaeicola sp.]|uniref:hypothetical protein n=1 Tax=uncultured Phocaeicola sp. TaxID=990718 RepID=UPI00258D828D|nr:hypothetical protein [uncultured Phocaeicola sp.]
MNTSSDMHQGSFAPCFFSCLFVGILQPLIHLLIREPVVSGHLVTTLSASFHSSKRKLLKADCEGTWKAWLKGG